MEIETEIKFLVFIPITSYLFSIHLDGRKIPVFSAENVAETLITEIIGHVMAHRIGDYVSIKKKKTNSEVNYNTHFHPCLGTHLQKYHYLQMYSVTHTIPNYFLNIWFIINI